MPGAELAINGREVERRARVRLREKEGRMQKGPRVQGRAKKELLRGIAACIAPLDRDCAFRS